MIAYYSQLHMTNYTFHWEIKDVMTQFVAAFDDVLIKRYNQNRTVDSSLHVRYAYAPKERVLYDIANKAQNITIPAICVTISSVTRANDRVFNKVAGYHFGKSTQSVFQPQSQHVRMPVPVDIGVNVSIITKYQTDMDQIISNFVPYANPYIVLSWKFPVGFDLDIRQEIRSEVLWNGSINLSYPVELNSSEKARVVGDTSFVIKGWLFPAAEADTTGNIYIIDANLYALSAFSAFPSLSSLSMTYPTSAGLTDDVETVALSGFRSGPLAIRTESGRVVLLENGNIMYNETTLNSSISSEIR